MPSDFVLTTLVMLLFPAIVAFAAASDLFTMRISNYVSLLLVAGFAVTALAAGMPIANLWPHLAAGALMLAISFGFFAAGWIGGGDAKFASAIALWIGFSHLLDYALAASAFGGLLTLLLLWLRRLPLPPVLMRQEWIYRLHAPTNGVPYGIALAAAALLVYPDTVWMTSLLS